MFGLSTKVHARLLKKSAKAIDAFYKVKGRMPYLSEVGAIQVLNWPERIGFFILGGVFLFISYLFIRAQSWGFPILFVPISAYVALRGLIGHCLTLKVMDSGAVATPESVVSALKEDLTDAKRIMLTLDVFVAILVVVIELTLTLIGAILSGFT